MTLEDCISRQAVLEIQAKYAEYVGATKFWQMRDDVKALPPVIPQEAKSDVLDKIREEIEEMYYIDEGLSFDPQISREDVLKIIDKYKAESEG